MIWSGCNESRAMAWRLPSHRVAIFAALFVIALAVAGCVDPAPSGKVTPVAEENVVVRVDASVVERNVTRQLLGQAVWYSWQAYARDSQSGATQPAALSAFASLGAGILGHYPGVGVITHDFHWKNVIGPISKRTDPTPRQSSFDTPRFLEFGPDEYGALLEEYRTATGLPVDGSIQVNIVNGTAEEAADWVEYMNAPADGSNPGGGTDWAQVRADNGHPQPYGIRYWELGNEPYFTASKIGSLTAQEYVNRIRSFVPLMKERDPSIEVMAYVNPFQIGNSAVIGTATKDVAAADGLTWSQLVIRDAGDLLDYLYFHWYGGWNDRRTDYDFMMTSMDNGLTALLDRTANDVKAFAPSDAARQRLSRIMITEWNVYGGWVKPLAKGTALQGALATSRTLHTLASRDDVAGAIHLGLYAPFPKPTMRPRLTDIREGYFLFRGQENQPQVMGTAAAAVAQLWSEAFQPNAVQVAVDRSPTFANGVPALDVTALRSESGDQLSLIVTNASKSPVSVQVNLSGNAGGQATLLTVTGSSPSDNNSWKQTDKLTLQRRAYSVDGPTFALTVPAYSVQALLIGHGS